MKIEITTSEFIPTPEGGYFKHIKRTEETKAEDRHSMLCNYCGNSLYPDCRKYCSGGGLQNEPK